MLKTILACLTTKEHASDILKVAVPLARRNDAHLIGLHTLEALEVYPGIAMHVSSAMLSAFNKSQKDESAAIEAIFRKHTDGEEFVSEYRLVKARATSASKRMVESARAADLVIMAHADKDADRYDQRHAQADVIRQSGRPVIIVPPGYDGPDVGNRIIVGWSETREAARATHDMLLVAAPDAQINLLAVKYHTGDELYDADLIDMTASLARHGLNVELRHKDQGDDNIPEILMNTAFEQGADLVVTGAFGHSAVYDFVMGATSRTLLREAKLPVLFSK